MQKEITIGNNLLFNTFLMLIDFINSKNPKLDLNVFDYYSQDNAYKDNTSKFFRLGQLLMFFYITNINSKNTLNIKYKKNRLCPDLCKTDDNESSLKDITSQNIIYNFIEKSIYSKRNLPIELDSIDNIDNRCVLDIQQGFELTYKIFIEEKMNIIDFLSECCPRNVYSNLIKDIKLLNPHDLGIQVNLIKLKFLGKLPENQWVEKVISNRDNHNKFIENSRELLDLLIKNAIISFYKNKIELMWLGYIDKQLKPIKYKNIYLALYFAYIGKNTCENYYIESAKQALNPLLNDIQKVGDNYIDMLGSDYYNVLNLLYLLSDYIEYEELNRVVENNADLFSLVKLRDKIKSDSNTESLILQYVHDNSLELLNSLILN